MTDDVHISRSWGRDRFAPDCGCALLVCGHVSAKEGQERKCFQHDPAQARTLRSQHPAGACDQDFARTALSEDPDYVGNERDVLGEDENGIIFAARAGSADWWERFDRSKPHHMAAYERTKATGRLAFLELEH